MYNNTSIYNAFKSLVGYKEDVINYPFGRQTSGSLVVGKTYKILTYITNDDFLNVGATANITGNTFVATGTTPTHWTHLSLLQDQTLVTSTSELYVNDLSGINFENIQSSRPTDVLSTYLDSIYNPTVKKMLDSFVSKSKNYLENKELQKIKSINNNLQNGTLDQTGCFIGYYINFAESYSLQLAIKNIAVQVDTAQAALRIFLYNLNKKVAEKYIDIPVASFDKTYTTLTDWLLSYKTDTLSGNKYIIGFYEYQSATPKAWQLSQNTKHYKSDVSYTVNSVSEIIPIKLESDLFNWNALTETFDLPNITEDDIYQYSYNNIYFNYIIDTDYTNIIIDNVQRFAELLQYNLALKITADILGSNAFNQIQNSNLEKYTQMEKRLKVDINGFQIQNTDNTIGYSNGLVQNLIQEFENTDAILFPLKRTIKF